jgi:mannose-6-phosphate isomerase-like protein (cupin superfamily)
MEVVDLTRGDASGPLWGAATEDLNVTLLAWPSGGGPAAYANPERDVLLVILEGGGTLELDDASEPLRAGTAVVVPKQTRFRVDAGADGIRYLTVHVRRGGLELGRF